MHTKVNVVGVVLFTKSHVSTVAISTLEIIKMHQKQLEQHFQYFPKKVMHDDILDSFSAHFAKTFTQKLIP